ncbi:MAG: PIG-L family deacetylase [Chloroflexota bacterium]
MTSGDITIMAVHAHPDDEVVFTGGTLLRYHRHGVRTVLVTATGGEEGEIHDPDLDPEEARPRLREIRLEELRRGTALLEIDDLELLGYRDSGMVGTEANADPSNFHNADLEEATNKLVMLVRRYRPQIMITYDEFGAYGHPDHIKANVITRAAFDKAGDPTYALDLGEPWTPLKLYYTHWNDEGWEKAKAVFEERGLKWPFDREEEQPDTDPEHQSIEEAVVEHEQAVEAAKEEDKPPAYVPPPTTTRIDVHDFAALKMESARQHRTQFDPNGVFMSVPEDIVPLIFGDEHYTLVESRVPAPEQEDDMLAGLV